MNLCETTREGHHGIYLDALLKLNNTREVLLETKLESSIINIKDYITTRYKLLKKYLRVDGDIHLLYLDIFYVLPIVSKLNRKKKVLGTLHFIPTNRIKLFLLKNFSKKIDLIIIHSEVMKEQLLNLGVKNIEVVDYPSFYDYNTSKSKETLRKENKLENSIVLTALGGTRNDKGLDILLEAFKYLDESLKEKLILNIAGKEENFKRDFIQRKAKEYSINLREEYGFLTEKNFIENIVLTDIMLMPYKKIFGGNSGPMTEAIVNKIPCITPKGINIGDLTEKYNLGLTFECENPKELAKTIEKMVMNKKREFFTNDYYKKLTIKNFLKRHEEIYNKIKKGEI